MNVAFGDNKAGTRTSFSRISCSKWACMAEGSRFRKRFAIRDDHRTEQVLFRSAVGRIGCSRAYVPAEVFGVVAVGEGSFRGDPAETDQLCEGLLDGEHAF